MPSGSARSIPFDPGAAAAPVSPPGDTLREILPPPRARARRSSSPAPSRARRLLTQSPPAAGPGPAEARAEVARSSSVPVALALATAAEVAPAPRRRTVEIPLDVPIERSAARRIDRIVARALVELADEGWVPAHRTDFVSLLVAGRLQVIGARWGEEREYFSAQVRLRKRKDPPVR